MVPEAPRAQPAACVSSETVVCLATGGVRGAVEADVVSFRGIPYAEPPLDSLRWRPPQPAKAWTGVRDATVFGPVCPQLSGGDVIGDEDCLRLNVWTPRERTGRARPVMVYLTGGGNFGQSGKGGGGANFVGTRLVPEGVVLVTVNIRLGALGFLSLPALDAESERHVSGNYGSQDHIAMLRWVQQHIRAFGGDPDRVFLFGTSAGGASVCGLMTSPLARGLFHAAAMESSVPTGCEFQTRAQAQDRTGARLVAATGCDHRTDAAVCLRKKSPKDLVTALRAVTDLFPRTYGPIVDGYVFPDQPIKRLAAGQRERMPLIIGNNLEEAASWVDSLGPLTDGDTYRAALERVLGADLRDRVVAQYPLSRFSTPREALVRAMTDALFTCATRRVTRAVMQGGGGPVYRYLFTYHHENAPANAVGHSVEMPFLFQSWTDYKAGPGDRAVSEHMIGFWTRLAKTGNPTSGASEAWTPVSAKESPYLRIDARFAMMPGDADAKCDFWDSVALPSPHL